MVRESSKRFDVLEVPVHKHPAHHPKPIWTSSNYSTTQVKSFMGVFHVFDVVQVFRTSYNSCVGVSHVFRVDWLWTKAHCRKIVLCIRNFVQYQNCYTEVERSSVQSNHLDHMKWIFVTNWHYYYCFCSSACLCKCTYLKLEVSQLQLSFTKFSLCSRSCGVL